MSSETSVAKATARNDADDRADDFAGGESDRRRVNRQPSSGKIPEWRRQQPDASQRKLILMLRHDQTPKLTGCMRGDRHGAKPWFMPPSATPQTVYCNNPSRLSARQHDHRPVSGLASRVRIPDVWRIAFPGRPRTLFSAPRYVPSGWLSGEDNHDAPTLTYRCGGSRGFAA